MSISTDETAGDLAFVTEAADRYGRVRDVLVAVTPLMTTLLPLLQEPFLQELAALPQLFEDVPQLASLARRGVLDRSLIQQHAGHAERSQAVRDLHAAFEMAGGLIVCAHCSCEFRLVEYPCPTLVALDG